MDKDKLRGLDKTIPLNINMLMAFITLFGLTAFTQFAHSQEVKTFTYSYGGKYVGQTKDNLRHGKGTMTWANGDKYVGGFEDDKKSGRGKYEWGNGDTYEGTWANDKMNGEGTFTFADGQEYTGEFENDMFNGEGTMTWTDGAKYVGEWKNGEKSGRGMLLFANGDKYQGEFKDDEMYGEGTFTYADGREYTGGFAYGKFADLKNGEPEEKIVDRIVAVVNDSVITLSELKETVLNVKKNPSDPDAQSEVLEFMIEEKLLEQEAKKQGVQVTEQEVDIAIENVRKRFNMTEEQMKEVLKKQNLTPEGFRNQWRRLLLSNKLVGTQIQGQIAVTEDEVKEYYEGNYGKLRSVEETSISHILIPLEPSEEEARNLAEEVARLAKSGKDFGDLAEEYSKDETSAGQGGNLGYFKKGDLVAELEGAIEGASVGDVIGPVKSPAGYHIIKVTDRKESEAAVLDTAKEEVREEIYKQKADKIIQTWLEDVKGTAYIERKL